MHPNICSFFLVFSVEIWYDISGLNVEIQGIKPYLQCEFSGGIMKKNKAYIFRIKPNKNQVVLINKTIGSVRYVYNHFLAERKNAYENNGINLSYNECSKQLTLLKKELLWLKEVDSIALQQSLRHLDTAYQNFFRDKQTGYPKFKGRHTSKASYTTVVTGNNIEVGHNYIKLPRLGKVKARIHREISDDYKLKGATVERDRVGNYYVSVLFEYEKDDIYVPIEADRILGLDFALPKLFVSSEGKSASYPQYLRESEDRLSKEQRKLSKCDKGSNNYYKQKHKVAKLHKKISNQRKDFLHKLSTNLARSYSVICIEDINLKAMSRSLHLGKSVHDASWGTFTGMLEYKLADRGKYQVKVDRMYPSSKTCSNCGSIKKDLELSDREYICNCGYREDRDINAAINIRGEGLQVLSHEIKIPKTVGHTGLARLSWVQ